MSIPTWAQFEEESGFPRTEAEYRAYLKLNYKDQLEDDSENDYEYK
jgi:hypothetical protein